MTRAPCRWSVHIRTAMSQTRTLRVLNPRGLTRRERSVTCLTGGMRHAIRRLRSDPGLTLLVTLTLALGVGVNSAIFSLMNSLHRPLPVRDAGRLVALATRHQAGSTGAEGMQYRFTYPALADFRAQARSYSDLIALDLGHGGLDTGDNPQEFFFSYASGKSCWSPGAC